MLCSRRELCDQRIDVISDHFPLGCRMQCVLKSAVILSRSSSIRERNPRIHVAPCQWDCIWFFAHSSQNWRCSLILRLTMEHAVTTRTRQFSSRSSSLSSFILVPVVNKRTSKFPEFSVHDCHHPAVDDDVTTNHHSPTTMSKVGEETFFIEIRLENRMSTNISDGHRDYNSVNYRDSDKRTTATTTIRWTRHCIRRCLDGRSHTWSRDHWWRRKRGRETSSQWHCMILMFNDTSFIGQIGILPSILNCSVRWPWSRVVISVWSLCRISWHYIIDFALLFIAILHLFRQSLSVTVTITANHTLCLPKTWLLFKIYCFIWQTSSSCRIPTLLMYDFSSILETSRFADDWKIFHKNTSDTRRAQKIVIDDRVFK